jgi:glycosyltransferase involved in cell wall biosynthesis
VKPINQLKILILTHRVPFPQNGGYPIVVCNTIRGLVNLGHDVSLVSLNAKKHRNTALEDDDLLSKIQYRSFDIDASISLVDGLINIFSKNSYNIERYYDQNFEKLLIRTVRNTTYDIIQFEGLFVAPYIDAVRKNCKTKLVYRAHNIEHQIWERLSQQKSDPVKKLYLKLMAKRIKKYEIQQINKFDAIAVFTGQDHNNLANDELRVKFYVAGNDIPEEFDDYGIMGKVFIQGEVDDGLEFVNSKSIMIVPLLSGGGMRVKIVEGMAMQKCIISTSLGAEGINYKNGVNILIANNRDEFFKAIKRCIADEDYCMAVGLNARKLIEAQHDVNKVTNNLVNLYQGLL